MYILSDQKCLIKLHSAILSYFTCRDTFSHPYVKIKGGDFAVTLFVNYIVVPVGGENLFSFTN